jgi:hypothetical protein
MTRVELIATTVQTLAETFRVALTKPAARGYKLGLEDLTEDEINFAAGRALRECKFMPSPSELRAFARPPRSLEARAAAAWAKVREAIRRYDYTVASIDFGPLTNTVLRAMGSWAWLCELGDEAMKWEAKRFAELFAAFASGPETALRPEPLEGWGRGRTGCAAAFVAIEGEIAPLDPRRAIEGPASPVRNLVRELAEEKTFQKHPSGEVPRPEADAPSIHVRESAHCAPAGGAAEDAPSASRANVHKPPVKITEDEKAAAVARMAAQLEARRGAA